MKTVLFVHGGKVLDGEPTAHFLKRTQAAIDYWLANASTEQITIVISGRWPTASEEYAVSEAEIAKRYIRMRLPDAVIVKEDISVELIGNYAFAKPIIAALHPDKTIIFTTDVLRDRTELITRRIFAGDLPFEIRYLPDTVTDRANASVREHQALDLFTSLFKDVHDGDDAAFRTTLLYETPYYFKGLIDDKTYFDRYWDGGYDQYLYSRTFYK